MVKLVDDDERLMYETATAESPPWLPGLMLVIAIAWFVLARATAQQQQQARQRWARDHRPA